MIKMQINLDQKINLKLLKKYTELIFLVLYLTIFLI